MSELRVGGAAADVRSGALRLDVAEWLAVAGVLEEETRPPAHASGQEARALPADFQPDAFGIAGLSTAESRAAWRLLKAKQLAQRVPASPGLADLDPGFRSALVPLRAPQLRIELRSWWQATSVSQSVAWRAPRFVALSRRRRQPTASPRAAAARELEQEPAVHLELGSGGSPLQPVMAALPPEHATGPPGAPVTLSTRSYTAMAQAVREGRLDVAEHAAGLTGEPLANLGALAHGVPGGALVTTYTPGSDGATRVFQGLWVWTAREVLEIRDANEAQLSVQPTSAAGMRTTLLSVLTSSLSNREA